MAGRSPRTKLDWIDSAPSSIISTCALGASHRIAACLATASMTGRTSVGEAEITRRISLIAVCCSSAVLRATVRSSTFLSSPA